MKETKYTEFCKLQKGDIIEYVYSKGFLDCIGYIWFDGEDYLYKPYYFFMSRRLGKGKTMKEIAERLIQLNYK